MVKKRKKYSNAIKARIAIEAIKGLKTMSELSSEYGIHPTQINKWKKQLQEGAPEIFISGNIRMKNEEQLTAPLYEEIGRLRMENNWLKKKL